MEEELKNIWKEARGQELVSLNHTHLIEEMEKKHKTVEKAIKNRDRREILVSLLMMPIFLAIGIFFPYTLTKVGAFLTIPVLGFIIYKLKSVKKYKPLEENVPTQEYLEGLKLYYTMQKDLLKEVLYWYLIPLGFCSSLVYLGMPFSTLSKGLYLGFVTVMYIGIYFMNQSAVKKRYLPLLKNIDESLAAFKKD